MKKSGFKTSKDFKKGEIKTLLNRKYLSKEEVVKEVQKLLLQNDYSLESVFLATKHMKEDLESNKDWIKRNHEKFKEQFDSDMKIYVSNTLKNEHNTTEISKGMQRLYDFCNAAENPNSITKSKMKEFVTEKEIKLIMSRLRGITLRIPKKGEEQEYPVTDIMFGIKQEPFMWD